MSPGATSVSPRPICNLHYCPELGSPLPWAALGWGSILKGPHPWPCSQPQSQPRRMEEGWGPPHQVLGPPGLRFAWNRSLPARRVLPLFQPQGKISERKNRRVSDIVPSVTCEGKAGEAGKNLQQLVLARRGKPELFMNFFFFFFVVARKVAFPPAGA